MTSTPKQYRGKKSITTGILIIAGGVLLLLHKMNINIPSWIVSWQMLLIGIGLSIGISTNFRKPASWILMVIGSFFLLNEFILYPVQIRQYFWPVLIIIVGIVVLLRPKRNLDPDKLHEPFKGSDKEPYQKGFENSLGDKIDSVSVFNGTKKKVISKNWQGGEAVAVFGGSEFNLHHADFDGQVNFELVTIFGGMKLIVPPGWEVRTKVTSIFGGIEDKRYSSVEVVPDNKVLILTGVVIFGGIDIVSF